MQNFYQNLCPREKMILAKNFNFAEKNISQNLNQIFGIGTSKLTEICHLLGFQPHLKKLKNNQIFKLLEFLDKESNSIGSNLTKKEKDKLQFLS